MRSRQLTAATAAAFVLFTASTAWAGGDVAHGEVLYQGCQDCHSLDTNDVGPLHRGVVGRRAGSVPGFVYSPELAKSGIVWTEAMLDRWLADPQAVVPGTRMYYHLVDPDDRADVIALALSPCEGRLFALLRRWRV